MTYFILSVRGFVTKIWHLKVWEKHVFTKLAPVHNIYITFSAWNLNLNSKSQKFKKQEWNGVSMEYFILSMGHFVAKIWLHQSWADLGKNAFSRRWQWYTVTQDDYELRKAAHVFGWWWGVEDGPAYVGWPRIKRCLFFWNFFRITKS